MHVKTVILRHDKNRNCQYCCVDLRMQLVETQSINEMDSSTPQLQSNTFPLCDSRTMRLSACAHCGRVIMKQAERKSTFTLWSLSWDICPLSSCYMSGFGQDRLQGHFLSVPSPISFPPYLNKNSFPGISTQPLVIWCRDQTCMQADSRASSLSVYMEPNTSTDGIWDVWRKVPNKVKTTLTWLNPSLNFHRRWNTSFIKQNEQCS